MESFKKEIAKVDKILQGNFASSSDKQYWVNKKAELERKEAAYANNLKKRWR